MSKVKRLSMFGLSSLLLVATPAFATIRYAHCDRFLEGIEVQGIVERSSTTDFRWAQLEEFVSQAGGEASSFLERERELRDLLIARRDYESAAKQLRQAEFTSRFVSRRFLAVTGEQNLEKTKKQLSVFRKVKIALAVSTSVPGLFRSTDAARLAVRLGLGEGLEIPTGEDGSTLRQDIQFMEDSADLYGKMAERAESVVVAMQAKIVQIARAMAKRHRNAPGFREGEIVDL